MGITMEQDILQLFLSGGSNVAFAGFLWYQYKEQQRRADEREQKAEIRERDIRDRYDRVIADYQKKEDDTRKELVSEINDLDKRMALVEQKLDGVNLIVQDIKSKFLRIAPSK